MLYSPFTTVLLKSHWYAPLVVETVSQKTLPTVVMGVPTEAVHATHDARLGMGATVFAPHTVAAVAVHDEPAGHGVHRVPPAVAMKKPDVQAVHPGEVVPALTLIVPAAQFVHVRPAVEYLPAGQAPPHAVLLNGAPVTPSRPAGQLLSVPILEPGGQNLPDTQFAAPAGDAAFARHVFPALHGFDVAVVLPGAVQKPAAQLVHAGVDAPAAEYVPAAQTVGAFTLATQKEPAMHVGDEATLEKLRGQYLPSVQAVAVGVVLFCAMQ